MLEWNDFNFRLNQSTGFVELFDDLGQIVQLLIATAQDNRVDFRQHFNLYTLELLQRQAGHLNRLGGVAGGRIRFSRSFILLGRSKLHATQS